MSDSLERQEVLRGALVSTEETIRAYDLKAEIAMICFVLSIDPVHRFVDFTRLKADALAGLVVLFLLFIFAVVGFMSVLLPIYKRRRPDTEGYAPLNVFFVSRPEEQSVERYLRTLQRVDLMPEMAQQVIMLSQIRDSKHRRFLVALMFALMFYAVSLVTGARQLLV